MGSYLFDSVLGELTAPDRAFFYAKERCGLAGNWLFQGLEGELRWRCCRLPNRSRAIVVADGILNGCKRLETDFRLKGMSGSSQPKAALRIMPLRRDTLLMNTDSSLGGYIPDPPGPDDDRFGRAFKNWREWNVVVNFLTNLHCGADESKIFSLTADPPDVIFKSARFEVKEIMDPGRRRHDEVKATRAHIASHGGRSRTVDYTPKDLTPQGIADLMEQVLEGLAAKGRYTAGQRRDMDLLFYVNKLEYWFEDGEVPDPVVFESYGWRSVSAVINTQPSIVFHASADAPQFLIENIGVVRHRWEYLDDGD